tara:strand:- start:2829 stop:3020 length:192 start_codon:yes stop_codon:yes gene_type:complete
MIEKCFYDFTKNTLKVKFNGGQVYEYENVDAKVYEDFCTAESTGKYFIENIRNNYEYTQLITE